AAGPVCLPFVLNQALGGKVVQNLLNDGVRDRASRTAILRTFGVFPLWPKPMHHESDFAAVASRARIFISLGLVAKIRCIGQYQQVVRKRRRRVLALFLRAALEAGRREQTHYDEGGGSNPETMHISSDVRLDGSVQRLRANGEI